MFHLKDIFHKRHHDAPDGKKGGGNPQPNAQKEEEYTNIYTTSGKRLKKIPGGWTLSGTGGDIWEDDIVSR